MAGEILKSTCDCKFSRKTGVKRTCSKFSNRDPRSPTFKINVPSSIILNISNKSFLSNLFSKLSTICTFFSSLSCVRLKFQSTLFLLTPRHCFVTGRNTGAVCFVRQIYQPRLFRVTFRRRNLAPGLGPGAVFTVVAREKEEERERERRFLLPWQQHQGNRRRLGQVRDKCAPLVRSLPPRRATRLGIEGG